MQRHNTQATDLTQAQVLSTLPEISSGKSQENADTDRAAAISELTQQRLNIAQQDGIALTTGMPEIPFLRMVWRHRLTAQARGVMIEPYGMVKCKAGLGPICIFATAAIDFAARICFAVLVAMVVCQKTVPAGCRNIKELRGAGNVKVRSSD